MKAFIEHEQGGLFYQHGGQWVPNPIEALAFSTTKDAEDFRKSSHIETAHTVSRLDPALIARSLARPPGIYQSGE